jgi:hypothetical protein
MPIFVDARLPVHFASAAAGPGDALLIEGEGMEPEGVAVAHFLVAPAGHLVGCPCCAPRGPVVQALLGLFIARVRGECPHFARVIVMASAAGQVAVRQALAEDVFLAGRYRAAE